MSWQHLYTNRGERSSLSLYLLLFPFLPVLPHRSCEEFRVLNQKILVCGKGLLIRTRADNHTDDLCSMSASPVSNAASIQRECRQTDLGASEIFLLEMRLGVDPSSDLRLFDEATEFSAILTSDLCAGLIPVVLF